MNNKEEVFKKKYEEYLEKFKKEKDCGKLPQKVKPVSFEDFIPDSYKI